MEWGWILLLAVAAYWLYAFSQNWAKKKQLGPGAQLHRFYRREGKRESSPMAGRSNHPGYTSVSHVEREYLSGLGADLSVDVRKSIERARELELDVVFCRLAKGLFVWAKTNVTYGDQDPLVYRHPALTNWEPVRAYTHWPETKGSAHGSMSDAFESNGLVDCRETLLTFENSREYLVRGTRAEFNSSWDNDLCLFDRMTEDGKGITWTIDLEIEEDGTRVFEVQVCECYTWPDRNDVMYETQCVEIRAFIEGEWVNDFREYCRGGVAHREAYYERNERNRNERIRQNARDERSERQKDAKERFGLQ